MGELPKDSEAESLLSELSQLTQPRTPAHLFRDATGLFVPGFAGLPAVTIVEAVQPSSSRLPDRFTSGRLYSFETEQTSLGPKEPLITFLTPLENMSVPPVRFASPTRRERGLQTIQVESRVGWNKVEIVFAFLPWDASTLGDDSKMIPLLGMCGEADFLPGRLAVSLVTEEGEVPLHPRWGLCAWNPTASTESLVFPFAYARKVIEPFVFRLCIEPVYALPGGKTVYLDQDITLCFRFREPDLSRLHAMAGLPAASTAAFTIVGNAVPMANVDLKAWEPDVSYADFARTTAMKPLGFAGIVPYKQSEDAAERTVSLDDLSLSRLPLSAQMSLESNKDGQLVSRYAMVGPGHEDKQLLFWMTYGSALNGAILRYSDAERIQPMHVVSDSLRQSVTLTPCFGGYDCDERYAGDLYNSLVLNYNTFPQTLVFKDTLVFAVKDFLGRLGYLDSPVSGPFIELRLVEGGRQRVVVVYVRDNSLRPILKRHLDALRDYVDQRSPLGTKVLVEVI